MLAKYGSLPRPAKRNIQRTSRNEGSASKLRERECLADFAEGGAFGSCTAAWIWWAAVGLFRSKVSFEAGKLVLRHKLNVLRRKSPKRLAFRTFDRLVFADSMELRRAL
jgi:hypothetical protein